MEAATGSGFKLVVMEGGVSRDIEELEDRGKVVASQYALVRAIFSYLPWKDLETTAKVVGKGGSQCSTYFFQVCKLWQEVFAICVKERRRYDSVR